jgi:hypothetical protein
MVVAAADEVGMAVVGEEDAVEGVVDVVVVEEGAVMEGEEEGMEVVDMGIVGDLRCVPHPASACMAHSW